MRTCLIFIFFISIWGCSGNTIKKTNMEEFRIGTFGYDYNFLKKYHKNLVILSDSLNKGMVILCPSYQGRVMTSSVNGMESFSNGWINFELIKSDKKTKHINAFGGEERIWLGPEGGPFSIYFAPDVKQEFQNWQVPAILDTEAFKLDSATSTNASFSADINITNYSGTTFKAKIERHVSLLNRMETENLLSQSLDTSLNLVAYQSENKIINKGQNSWTKQTGVLSIWMLTMLNPSSSAVIFIPFKEGNEKTLGNTVSDDYFGKVPPDRLKIQKGIIYFKADGKYRSKIGISPKRVNNWAASYDFGRNALTLLYCDFPKNRFDYVNSKWGLQDEPFAGDAINAYNDGPVEDGTQMGPFYELESSSPGANLNPGEELNHIQTILHIEGTEVQLDIIVQKLFSISLKDIKTALK